MGIHGRPGTTGAGRNGVIVPKSASPHSGPPQSFSAWTDRRHLNFGGLFHQQSAAPNVFEATAKPSRASV